VSWERALESDIRDALDVNLALTKQGIKEQFEKLIF
jgi:hypothetical protein